MEPHRQSDDHEPPGLSLQQKTTRPRLRDITYISTKPFNVDIRESYVFSTHLHDSAVNNINLDNCILINVTFKNCTIKDVTLSNCYLEDVVFDECDLSDDIWQNVRLIDRELQATDYTGDRDVRLEIPNEIEDPTWLDDRLRMPTPHTPENNLAAQSAQPINEPWPTVEDIVPSVQEESAWSDTVWPVTQQEAPPKTYISTFQSTNSNQPRLHSKEWGIFVPKISRAAKACLGKKVFPFMELPPNVRVLVYEELLCPSQLIITDTVRDRTPPPRQLWYWMWNKYCQEKRKWRSTYIAGSPDTASLTSSINTSILCSGRSVYAEALLVLYNQTITFDSSAEGALTWLHDQSKHLDKVKAIIFVYRFDDRDVLGPNNTRLQTKPTNDLAFRRLMNALVHKCEALEYFGLRIDHKFWSSGRVRWKKGVEHVMQTCGLLQQVRRLAYFDAKTAQHQPGNNGVHLQIAINQTNTLEKREFVEKLERAIQTGRAERPRIAKKRVCCCSARSYEDCCYVDLPHYEKLEYGAFVAPKTTQASGDR